MFLINSYMAFNKDYAPEESVQSRFNAAGLINSALEGLWGKCYLAMASGNLTIWNRHLDAIWTILGGDVVEGENEDIEMSKINMSIYKTGSLNHKRIGFERLTSNDAESMAMQYLLLNKKSLFLRRLQNSQGKGTAYATPDMDDFD